MSIVEKIIIANIAIYLIGVLANILLSGIAVHIAILKVEWTDDEFSFLECIRLGFKVLTGPSSSFTAIKMFGSWFNYHLFFNMLIREVTNK